MHKSIRVILGVSLLSMAGLAYGAGITIGGTTYYPLTPTETVSAPFTSPTGSPTVNSYYGYVLLTVSGTGQAAGTAFNDAFYVFTNQLGNPVAPGHDANFYQLRYSRAPMAPLQPQFDAYLSIVFDVNAGMAVTPPYTPAYQGTHTYSFVVPAGTLTQLYFGVSDGNFTDNGGTYSVVVTQLVPAEVSQISYAGNLGAGQSVVNITNSGTTGGNDKSDYICANVYVFAEDQQLISCCTCELSPNDLQTLSVQNDLINNTLTPGVPTGVTVEILASDDTGKTGCNAAAPLGAPANPGKLVSGLRAWGTHLHAAPGGGFGVTETPFSKVGVSSIGLGSEFDKMTSFCGFIQADGSKYGICNSCKPGAQGAKKQ